MTTGVRRSPGSQLLAWSLLGVSTVAVAVGTWLAVAVADVPLPPAEAGTPTVFLWTMLVFVVVGVILAARVPRNPIGWLLAGVGIAWQADVVAGDFRTYALVVHPGLTGGVGAALAFDLLWVVPFAALFLIVLLFPDGRLLSVRWWVAVAALGSAVAMMTTALALRPGPLSSTPSIDNPLGIDGFERIADGLESIATLLLVAVALVAVAAVLLRYRRGDGVARHQLKWLLLAIGVVLAASTAGSIVVARGAGDPLVAILNVGPLVLVPLAIGVAVTRYRLYDIDRVVSRTVTYAVVVAVLGATYLGLVVVLRGLVPVEGDLPVAVSTLVVAALFLPLVRRVQRVVDRRFFRSRYDAGVVVARVADELRGSLDLAEVTGRVGSVVDEVLAPEVVFVWVAEEPT